MKNPARIATIAAAPTAIPAIAPVDRPPLPLLLLLCIEVLELEAPSADVSVADDDEPALPDLAAVL